MQSNQIVTPPKPPIFEFSEPFFHVPGSVVSKST